jgi:adenylosuccinate lyase
LGTVIGKQTAHELVYESAMTAIEQHVDFLELIYQRSEVSDHFSRDELKSWTNAENDLGNISERIDLVLARAKSLKNG